MSDLSRVLSGFLVLAVVAGGLLGCGDGESTAEYGDWALNEEGLILNEDLLVSETDSFYFGSIVGRNIASSGPGLDVLSDGRIVVADDKAQQIRILRPDGTLSHTLGRPGQGPGEFQNLSSVQVARGDSIYAYEWQRRQLTVFAPASPHELARTVTIESDQVPPFRMLVTQEGVSALYGTPFMAGRDLDEPPVQFPWREVEEASTPGDSLFTVRMRRMASLQRGEKRFSLYPMPFERNMQVTPGPDGRFYVGRTDSFRVTAYGMDGSSEVVASIPGASVSVHEADRDSALAGIDNGSLRGKIRSALSDTKPAMTDLVVADDGRLWLKRPVEAPDADTTAWWVLDPKEKTIHEIRLPRAVNLEVVRNGRAYGSTTTDGGAPAVVRYRIRDES